MQRQSPLQETPLYDGASRRRLLLVDDDKPFLTRLGRAMETRGFTVNRAKASRTASAASKPRRPPSR